MAHCYRDTLPLKYIRYTMSLTQKIFLFTVQQRILESQFRTGKFTDICQAASPEETCCTVQYVYSIHVHALGSYFVYLSEETYTRTTVAAIQLETYESLVTAAIHSHSTVQGLKKLMSYTRRNILFFKYGLADGIRKLYPDCHRFLPIGNPFYIDRPISVNMVAWE